MMTFLEFLSKKNISISPKGVALGPYDAVKKLHTKPKGNLVKNMTKKGPDITKAPVMPNLKLSGSMTSNRPSGKTMPKTPKEFLPRATGHAPEAEKGIRLASL